MNGFVLSAIFIGGGLVGALAVVVVSLLTGWLIRRVADAMMPLDDDFDVEELTGEDLRFLYGRNWTN